MYIWRGKIKGAQASHKLLQIQMLGLILPDFLRPPEGPGLCSFLRLVETKELIGRKHYLVHSLVLNQGRFLPPRRYLVMSRDNFLWWSQLRPGAGASLARCQKSPGMLLNMLKYIRQASTTKNYQAPNVNGTKTEKP